MTPPLCRIPISGLIAAFAFLSLTAPLVAQTPPQASVVWRHQSGLQHAVVPGDFNGDLKMDLAAALPSGHDHEEGHVVIALGNGDGTFARPVSSALGGPLAVGDFDRDQKLDLVTFALTGDLDLDPRPELRVNFGKGDGTVESGQIVITGRTPGFVLTRDFNGDGHLDVLVGNFDGQVEIIPGNGDRTFGASVRLTAGETARRGAAGDLDGDGDLDFFVATYQGNSVTVFLNDGGLLFRQRSIVFDRPVFDVEVGDVNRDGRADLLALRTDFEVPGNPAFVDAFLGQGDGTFLSPVSFPVNQEGDPHDRHRVDLGPIELAAGDFNRDGHLDVATGNSSDANSTCGLTDGFSSVTILPGRGDGTFTAGSTFALGNQRNPVGIFAAAGALSTADLNRDGHVDIVAANGHILLSRTPDPNWPPTVDAGPDQTVTLPSTEPVVLRASAGDVDQDWLRYDWRDASGATVGRTASICLNLAPGQHRITVTVDDGQGHTASDSVTITVTGDATGLVTVTAPTTGEVVHPDRPFTIQWAAHDTVGVSSYRVTVIYTFTDSTLESTPCSLPASARTCEWTPHTIGNNVRVVVEGLNSSREVVASGTSGTFRVARAPGELPPGWLGADVGAVGVPGSGTQLDSGAIVVRGAGADIWGTADAFHFVYQVFEGDGHASVEISDVQGTHAWTKAGLMIRQSLDPGSPHHFVLASEARGLAYQRRLTQGATSLHTSLGTSALPATVQIVRTGRRVFISLARSDGTGGRIAEFDFVEGPVLIGLAVTSHDATRLATGTFNFAEIDAAPQVTVTAPAAGEVLQAGRPYEIRWTASDDHGIESIEVQSSADDGVTWTFVCSVGEDIPLSNSCTWDNPGPVTESGRIRVVVNGARNDQAQAISERFSIRPSGTPGTLPAGWSNHDIGAVAAAGHATHDSATGVFTIEGSGADVWGIADEFHYAHTPVSGNFEMTARVASVENLHRWVKAGVMLREHLGASARHAFAVATPRTERGVVFQRRASEGGLSTSTASTPVAPPVWLRLVRTGDIVQASYRTSSTAAWIALGQQTFTALARDLQVGLAVSSHLDGQLATATFDNVSIRALP